MRMGDDGDYIAESYKGEIEARCKFCSAGYIINSDDYDVDFACEECQILGKRITDKDLFITPLRNRLEYNFNLKLCKVEHDVLSYERAFSIYTKDSDSSSSYVSIGLYTVPFGEIKVFLYFNKANFRLTDLKDFEADLKELL